MTPTCVGRRCTEPAGPRHPSHLTGGLGPALRLSPYHQPHAPALTTSVPSVRTDRLRYGRPRRMTMRGILLATASVVPTTEKPAFSNIERVPTKAIVVSIRPVRVDRVRLDGRCAVRGGIGDGTLEQVPDHALATVAAAHDEADDAPDGQVVGRQDQLRARQPGDLRARADVAPADRRAVEVGDDSRRVLALAQRAHRLLAAVRPVAAELTDLLLAQPVRQAPARVGPPVGVDDVGEVLEPVGRHRVRLPRGSAAGSRPAVRLRASGTSLLPAIHPPDHQPPTPGCDGIPDPTSCDLPTVLAPSRDSVNVPSRTKSQIEGVTRRRRPVSEGVDGHPAARRPRSTPCPAPTASPAATISGPYGRLLQAYARRTWGEVPDNAYVVWHHKKVMNAVLGFERKVAKWDALDPHLAVLRPDRQRRRHRLQLVHGLRLLPGPRRGPRRGQGARGAALARVRRVHPARARRHGVRRGDERHALRPSTTT